jgi:hypothetical protein
MYFANTMLSMLVRFLRSLPAFMVIPRAERRAIVMDRWSRNTKIMRRVLRSYGATKKCQHYNTRSANKQRSLNLETKKKMEMRVKFQLWFCAPGVLAKIFRFLGLSKIIAETTTIIGTMGKIPHPGNSGRLGVGVTPPD